MTLRTLIIETPEKVFEVTIPADWKVTYGTLQPRTHSSPHLRIYEGKEQRACFADVTHFRDSQVSLSQKRKNSRKDFERVEAGIYDRPRPKRKKKTPPPGANLIPRPVPVIPDSADRLILVNELLNDEDVPF